MTLKRVVLSILTGLVALVVASSLYESFSQPQVTGQLQLYQSDLLLQASEWDALAGDEFKQLGNALLGAKPLESVAKQYESVRKEAAAGVVRSQKQLAAQDANPQPEKFKTAITQQQTLIERIDLKLGIIATQQKNIERARQRWQPLTAGDGSTADVANVLLGLWATPPMITPTAEATITNQLSGWFQYRVLEQLYTLDERSVDLAQLNNQEQTAAESKLVKLAAVGTMPVLGCIIGVGVLIALGVQWFTKRGESLLGKAVSPWEVPWDGEIIWQVLIVGFFFVGQLLIPFVLQLSGLSFAATGSRGRALYSMIFYLLMSASGIAVLAGSIWTYRPFPKDWFQLKLFDRWPIWGVGGYVVALPLMIAISALNQKIWQGQGGNNPLLQTVLEESDSVALLLFFLTAAVAAPLFEEVLFRGFLLPSLTRYMPVWGAILLSSFIFASAHLSLSEVLPLTLLGAILAWVYTRSRNLLSPMLIHSLWNSATLLGLFLLGS
ncbi:CPBP family intramembrane metalloprotease [Leptolyngbya cf. ectocarpi LEGE 11479]|uniref:CPBP family intramembrane metalloprotease n=1 Tax=Leptolyngbya cf. ectocarpi LEGE 11479 TaxID=1828722 RepID=A0A928ZY91_LEPEC|nr:type II CAAX endopeptidase family protein [Leptolyngbya ectocarpi]MBE9069657.1 CPBP family intramembrane metalloprotease [Leptolyngbya cf. ectocarpi LEGE 11479]